MRRLSLACLALLAAITIAWILFQDRERDPAKTVTEASATLAGTEPKVELAAPEPLREPVGRSEVAPAEPDLREVLPVRSQARSRSAPELDEPADTVLVFHALDEAGRAVAGELSLTTRTSIRSGGSASGDSATADAEGRFEVRIDPFLEGARRELEVGARQGALLALVDLSRSFPPGRTDMGTLVLAAAPLIAAGRVIDAAGRPVVEAVVVAQTLSASRDGTPPRIESIYKGDETPQDGAFRLYGFTRAELVEIRIHHKHLRALTLTVPVGSQGIEIIAQGGGGVIGQVLVEPEVPVGDLRMILRPENVPADSKIEPYDSSRPSRKEVARDGRFRLEGLLPWTYTFSVAAGSDVLAEVPGIEIVAGEITRDPRLEPLDLRGRLHVFTLDLVPPSPSLALSGSVRFSASGTTTPVRRQYFQQSPVVLATPLTAIDAMVRVRDCRIERLSALAERTEVHLRPCLTVRLALPRDIVLPPPPLFLGAEIVREGERPEERARSYSEVSPTPPFDEHGETLCQAFEPGRHTIRWFVEHRWQGGGNSIPLDLPFDQVVVVEDREGEQRFELVVTSRALAAALESR